MLILPSKTSTFCLTRSWSTDAKYSNPLGHENSPCGTVAQFCPDVPINIYIYIPSIASTFCLTNNWSTDAKYSSPFGHPGGACPAAAHCVGAAVKVQHQVTISKFKTKHERERKKRISRDVTHIKQVKINTSSEQERKFSITFPKPTPVEGFLTIFLYFSSITIHVSLNWITIWHLSKYGTSISSDCIMPFMVLFFCVCFLFLCMYLPIPFVHKKSIYILNYSHQPFQNYPTLIYIHLQNML